MGCEFLWTVALLFAIDTTGQVVAAPPDKQQTPCQNCDTQRRTSDKPKGSYGFPMNCLVDMYMDLPGDEDDVFISLYYHDDCGNTGREELWSGIRSASENLPQTCDDCEPNATYGRGRGLRPHGLALTRDTAWKVLDAGLSTAGIDTNGMSPKLHRIPRGMATARDIDFIAVPIPAGDPINGVRYFGIEIARDSTASPVPLPNLIVTRGSGAQLLFDYRDNNQQRKGFIWLRQ